MALPPILKYVYTNGTDEVIRRGKKIHLNNTTEVLEFDALMDAVTFRIKDDVYHTFYKVVVQKFSDPKSLVVRCSCPYNIGEICRHESAALFTLQELLDKNQLSAEPIEYDQKHTLVKMKTIDMKTIRMLTSEETYLKARDYIENHSADIYYAENETVKARVNVDGQEYHVLIRRNEEKTFDTSSDEVETRHPLSLAKVIVFLQLLKQHNQFYFDSIRNWDNEKNKLLSIYGYSLEDDLKGKFEFVYKDGKPFLRVLDPSIKRLDKTLVREDEERKDTGQAQEPSGTAVQTDEKELRRIGVVINLNKKGFPGFYIDPVSLVWHKEDGFGEDIQKIDLSRYVQQEEFCENDRQLLPLLRKLSEGEINKYLNRNSPFSGIWENIIHHEDDDVSEDTRALIVEYLYPKLKKLIADIASDPVIYLLPSKKEFVSKNLKLIGLEPDFIYPSFSVEKAGRKYQVSCWVKINGTTIPVSENDAASELIFLHDDNLYFWGSQDIPTLLSKFNKDSKLLISKENWLKEFEKFILPLSREYHVEFDQELISEVKDGEPEKRVVLFEKGDYLVFQPVFNYKGVDTKPGGKDELLIPDGDKLMKVLRDKASEQKFFYDIRNLHSNFVIPEGGTQLALKGSDVLKNNWFFLFIDAMKEKKVPVHGFEALKNFRFNTARPETRIHISNNTDWFDARVDIVFGDQQVSIADVKKALSNHQQFVPLKDGSLGILPEEWIKKYSLLFRVGEGKQHSLRLSKYHVSIIDELYDNRNEEELILDLESKFESLKEFKEIKQIPVPKHLGHILRPYQEHGFHWLNYLKEIGWGGILADDMGLGKTLQTLCYLHYYKHQEGELNALVVCPTSLIFNWENEINKFTPSLTYHIHHGPDRLKDKDKFTRFNIIITTYGTLRSDIKHLMPVKFDYVVLDESQAIKNPSSKVTKAACLLNSTHRLCLSGTPLQNNTFDIYSQMNFLNPGMLGSVEFFKQEFSIPIDKFGEQEQKEHLKKLLYPFILRRTKEQVAKDLPDKTETILYCEMEEDQRMIYDAYRNDYRERIMGTIEQKGIQRSQFTILQGLMKLRQICDSPAILNEEEPYPNYSIKLEELTREINENIGNHKALVFSQFLGMLSLIRGRLEELGIDYEYFDGSTSAAQREVAIKRFQEDENCRIFLISLKAGGVGLNLTAADYVYIVDPWWNPAVEQQAIDRTHRIGQTKNIFAYRMICKDTIEDKIIQLQEKKRMLARDVITDDEGFVKTLTREDVEYLFS